MDERSLAQEVHVEILLARHAEDAVDAFVLQGRDQIRAFS
jgi:hypothetical protein